MWYWCQTFQSCLHFFEHLKYASGCTRICKMHMVVQILSRNANVYDSRYPHALDTRTLSIAIHRFRLTVVGRILAQLNTPSFFCLEPWSLAWSSFGNWFAFRGCLENWCLNVSKFVCMLWHRSTAGRPAVFCSPCKRATLDKCLIVIEWLVRISWLSCNLVHLQAISLESSQFGSVANN